MDAQKVTAVDTLILWISKPTITLHENKAYCNQWKQFNPPIFTFSTFLSIDDDPTAGRNTSLD